MNSLEKTFAFAGLCLALGGCGGAKVSAPRDLASPAASKPPTVYVMDFELDAGNIRATKGLLPAPPKPPGPLGNILPPALGTPKDPRVLAKELVVSMSDSLVKELTKKGLNARHLDREDALPTSGWLVRGVFTDVNQGNQLQRGLVGFGAGKTELQVVTSVVDLSRGTPEPFSEWRASADSGKGPGAAPMIALHPAAAAVRFVIAGGDLERNVDQSAAKLAAEIVGRVS